MTLKFFHREYAHLKISQVTGLKMTRHQKRKIDETHIEVLFVEFFLLTMMQ